MNSKDKLSPTLQVRAMMEQNMDLIVTINQHKAEIAKKLGEIFGLTKNQSNPGDLFEHISLLAPKWMRQWNLLDKRKADLKTVGKILGINGTSSVVMDRLSLFKFFYGEYKAIHKLAMMSHSLKARFD